MYSRLLSLIGFLFILRITGIAQVIQVEPSEPSLDEAITLTFDATQGSGGLANCSCDVYIHTGLITKASANDGDWKHVVTEWGVANSDWKMTRISGEANKYQFTISPSILGFYGANASEGIVKLAFVFRNATGSLEGKDVGGKDLFFELPTGSIQLTAPLETYLVQNLGDEILVSASSEREAAFLVKDNGILLSEQSGTALNYTLLVEDPGRHTVEVMVDDGVEQRMFSFQYMALAPPSTEPGIFLQGDTLMRLALYAPGKKRVQVLGSFNNWQRDEAYLMTPDADSATWTIEIGGLVPGENYTFQYLIDESIRIADPYSTVVLDPDHDPFIPGVTYPDLPEYPTGGRGIVSLVQPGLTAYEWEVEDFVPAAEEELVIYELLVRDFIDRHDYSTLIDTLNYLDQLGVNAIELMPINEFEGNISWGYNPSFHMALDKYYGSINEFKRFVDSCHARDIAVFLDVVYNHAFSQSPLAQLYWDQLNFRPAPDNPWLNPEARHPFNVGYDFNHESVATRTFVDKVMQYWLREFRVDGFRFDLSKGLTQRFSSNDGEFRQYDEGRIATIKHYADVAWSVNPDAHLILEHFAENREEQELTGYGLMVWAGAGVHDQYLEASMGYDSDLSGADYRSRFFNAPRLIAYIESHDEERMLYKNLNFGNNAPGYNVQELSTALDRAELAHVFFYTIPGPKMMWQFGELGYDFPINYCPDGSIQESCRVDVKPIRWDYFQDPDRRDLYDVVRRLTFLKTNVEAFNTTDYRLNVARSDWKRIFLLHPEMDVAVQGNFSVETKEVEDPFPSVGWWYEYFSGDSLLVQNTSDRLSLRAGEYRLYTSVPVDGPGSPPASRYTVVRDVFHLGVFPNPTTGAVRLTFTLEQTEEVSLEIFNMLGQGVYYQENSRLLAGKYTATVDRDFPPGTYVVKLRVGYQVETALMVAQ